MRPYARSSARRESRRGTARRALEDALLAAYKKTPGASRHATVELDDAGDFRVFAIELPEDLEDRLLDEARERALDELERIEEETGEKNHTLLTDDDLDVDWSQVPDELIKREDVTPDNFGRIAAQTAKQVILQRIREAEREMMYDEYIDRVSEVVTGIVQQAGDRNNVLVDLGKVEALLPRSEQVDGERYEQGSRIKAVITEVRTGTKGPQVILSRRDPELIKTLFELEVPEIADGLVEIERRRARAGLPLEDRRAVAHPGRRPGRRLRRPARLARAHGRLRAPRREDRHHPLEPGAGALRREGALAGARARGLPRRRRQGGDRRRPRRPARAGDRQGGHERPPRPPAHRLEDRHRQRHASSPSRRPRRPSAARAARRATSRAAARRCSRTASAARTRRCRARSTAASPPTRSWRCTSPTTRSTRSSQESEPELEALSDTAEPESVTEDAAEFGNPEPEEFPGRARRRAGRRRGPDARSSVSARRVEDDPDEGIPIVHVHPRSLAGGGRRRRLARSGPAPAAAARRLRRELQRFHARGGMLDRRARGRSRRLHLPPARVLRAREGASRLQPHTEKNRPRRGLARAALHLRHLKRGGELARR